MKSVLFACLFASIFFPGFGQQKKYAVEGIVKDSANHKSIVYATVAIQKRGAAQALKSTYSNNDGKFVFGGIDTGAYVITVSHEGYANSRRPVILTGQSHDREQIADFILSPVSVSLRGVTVSATRPLIEQTDDKIIYNTESDPAAKTENAIDILRKTPFVSVDGDNNVQLNGQSNFKVLLNGKETAMFTQNVKEALRAFPGALIQKIEVITSPSAKYDAEGIGGIINIVTHKKVVGYNGSVSTFGNTNHGTGLNGNLSLKTGKIGLTVFYFNNVTSNVPSSTFGQTIPIKNSFYSLRTITADRTLSNFFQLGNTELSIDLDSLHTVSMYGNLSGGHNENTQYQQVTTKLSNTNELTNLNNYFNKSQYPSYNAGMDYITKFKGIPEKELDLKVFGEFSKNNTYTNTAQLSGSGNRFIDNTNLSDNAQYTLEADYILPVKAGQKLETGIKAILRKATADFQSLTTYDMSVPFKVDPVNTNFFRYTQDVFSAYGSYNFKIKKYGLRFGARFENTVINGSFVNSGTTVDQNYTNFIPNIQVTRKWSASYTSVLSYTMRLQRPFITSLNPFVNNNDSLNISYGNPNLGPQTIHAVSLQNRILKGSTFYGINFNFSFSNNAIESYSTFDNTKGVLATTSANIGREFQFGISPNMNVKFSNIWRMTLNGSLNYNLAENKFQTTQSNSGISGFAFMGNTFTLNKKLSLSAVAGFSTPAITVQTKRTIQHFYTVSGSYKFLNDKLSLNITAANFFAEKYSIRTTTLDPGFTAFSESTSPFRLFTGGLTWNFGKLKENVSKKKGVVNDDLIP